MDTNFAPAYLALADASLQAAEYEMTNKREARVREAMRRGRDLVEHALKLDPGNGAAYVTRARLESFTDAAASEGDYRRGLQLSPNYPAAYEGLASLLAETPARGAEALALLNRVHELDPLEPRYEVMRAAFLNYRLGKWREASRLLEAVIVEHPSYSPALTHLALIRQSEGRFADAIRLFEQALALDPQAEWSRRELIRTYLEYADLQAAQSVADEAPTPIIARQIPLFLARHDWRKAGDAAYEAIATRTLTVYDESPVAWALQKHALVTGEYARARDALQKIAGVSWDTEGHPRRDGPSDIQTALAGLAAVLQKMHEPARAAALIELQFKEQQNRTREFADRWYLYAQSQMLALAGKTDAAIELIARHRDIALEDAWYDFDINPVFDSIRNAPKFQQASREWQTRMEPQKALLAKYRAEGLVPDRSVD
jgi:tetratricopeptide (TPR) repeat protein